jgi:hypothetical protein
MNRTLVAVLLLVAGLAGLFMAACGGFFTVTGLFNFKDPYSGALLVVGAPSFLAGAALLWFVRRRYTVFNAPIREPALSQQKQSPPEPPTGSA